jgi:hypothetical protein
MQNKFYILLIRLFIYLVLPFEFVAQKYCKKDTSAYTILVTLNVLYFKLVILIIVFLLLNTAIKIIIE